ncbi:MAG: holo-ACP synthase [Clostridia bacterium]|nr:holo-ACP synthase [Clostridia bacterium]
MRVLVGTDIIEINRIMKLVDSKEKNALKSIFTLREIEYCEARKVSKYQSYAARFAAKEAIYKALSEFVPEKYSWTDFEVINSEKGKPEVVLGFEIKGLESVEISLSHCKEYAVAYVSAIIKEN